MPPKVRTRTSEAPAAAAHPFEVLCLEVCTRNATKLKAVGIDSGGGCVLPSEETVRNTTYKPLSRPLMIYVSKAALQRPEVNAFVKFYLENAAELVPQVGYVALEDANYQEGLGKLGQSETTTP